MERITIDSDNELFSEAEKIGSRPLLERGNALERQILTAPEDIKPEEALRLVEEMNSLTRYVATNTLGELNLRLFRAYEYHAVLQSNGKVKFIQGLDLRR